MTTNASAIATLIDNSILSISDISIRKRVGSSDTFSGPVYSVESIAIASTRDMENQEPESLYMEADFTIGIDWPDSGGNHGCGAIECASFVEILAAAILTIDNASIFNVRFIGSSNMGNYRGIVKTTMTFTIFYHLK